MESYHLERANSFSSGDEPTLFHEGRSMPPPPSREKSKRPQLSCNPCRNRKVKCDRIQPCTACSLHQIPECCQYDLSESERKPILQAEALKKKDKEIANLRHQIQSLGSQPIKVEYPDEDSSVLDGQRRERPPQIPRKPSNLQQLRMHRGNPEDNIYYGTPALANVIEEFSNLMVGGNSRSLTHQVPRSADVFAFQTGCPHPFPTLWVAREGTAGLVALLPPEHEIGAYIEAFQQRAQSCSFPHLPDECTKSEVHRFLENVQHNAEAHPDMLALLFATIAQGIQNGVFDRYGGQWIAGAMDQESKKGDIYVAAAMQALRLASFMNRPSLLAIETLIMIGPYLTNGGRFLDAWSLFGVTIRLAQSIGLHRDPSQLNPPAPLGEIMVRKNLWWWMLHMDQQYSMTLGRPLGISSMGDCPAPKPLIPNPVVQSLSNYIGQFTILARQILSSGYLSTKQVDNFTDQLLALKETLPEVIRFDETWLDESKPLPPWPLDAQAAVFYGKTHNFLVLLNRQRLENSRRDSGDSGVDTMDDLENVPRGRERVLESCRALLHAFAFFASRLRVALICWTMGQQAFNAAMILLLAMLESGDQRDLYMVHCAYDTFVEMSNLGIHKIASEAVEKLGALIKDVRTGSPAKEPVMSPRGMILLEDPGLQGFVPGGFTPLNFNMAGGELAHGTKGTGWAASGAGFTAPSQTAQRQRKKAQNRAQMLGQLKTKPRVPQKKPTLKSQRSTASSKRTSVPASPATAGDPSGAPSLMRHASDADHQPAAGGSSILGSAYADPTIDMIGREQEQTFQQGFAPSSMDHGSAYEVAPTSAGPFGQDTLSVQQQQADYDLTRSSSRPGVYAQHSGVVVGSDFAGGHHPSYDFQYPYDPTQYVPQTSFYQTTPMVTATAGALPPRPPPTDEGWL